MKYTLIMAALFTATCTFTAQAMDKEASTPMQQEYQQQMSAMHESMMSGMMDTNPDRAFARSMLAHHIGAVEMAKTELKYGKDPQMRQLAANIIEAQQKEITQMKAWIAAHPDKPAH
ncbi:hypothetical protein TUM12370_37220 [Salmonella enterica subsp. enterica serovar Choleraesuis]|nr:hypothetical protein TUM12370_37220 [Salmonella enterica subsp. enterica serovar Choleraesuis]